MSLLNSIVSGLRALFRKRQAEAEMDEELRAYLDAAVEEKMRSGMSREKALRAARVEMGSVEAVKDEIRSAGWESVVEAFLQDLRYALRQLRRSPGFTLLAVLTLALGIGANTAIFSVVDAVLLRPLPYRDPDRLVIVSERNPQWRWAGSVSPANYLDWQQQNRVFEGMAAYGSPPGPLYLTRDGEPEQLGGRRVSANFFSLLGVQPFLGRNFLPEEDRPDQRVVILSYACWQRHFGSDPKVIGRQLTFGEIPPRGEHDATYTVIGVMPKGHPLTMSFGQGQEDLWMPYPFTLPRTERRYKGLQAFARLKPGVSLKQAQAEMDAIGHQLEQAYPQANKGWRVDVRSLRDAVMRPDYGSKFRPALLLLMGAVGLVLLIACVNVASLLLVRGVAREREIAVRTALGAGRARLIRQLLTETLLLAALGATLGILLARWSVPVLVALSPTYVPRIDEAGVDGMALLFALAVALLTGLLCGLAPALESSKPDLNEALKDGSRGATSGRAQQRTQRLLVVGEVALALVVSTGAGLMLHSFLRLHTMDLGFDAENVLTAQLSLPWRKYAEPMKPPAGTPAGLAVFKLWKVRANMSGFVSQVVERLERSPGVQSAGAVNFPPLGIAWGADFGIEGVRPLPQNPSGVPSNPVAMYRGVAGEYFQTMKIGLIKGRYFNKQEMQSGAPVAIVNRRLARNFFPDGNVLGKRLRVHDSYIEQARLLEVVGVVEDISNGWPWTERSMDALYTIYMPFDQQGRTFAQGQIWFRLCTTFVASAASGSTGLSTAMRQAIREADPDQPIEKLISMKDFVSEQDSERRFSLLALSILAGLALVLAAAGIYGVMSYVVSQRTHEIGVRRALGADPRDILKGVLAQGAVLSLYGVALGLVGALALTGFLSSFLYGVTPTDAATFAAVTLLLVAVALLACYIPARRATKVDPMVALRYE